MMITFIHCVHDRNAEALEEALREAGVEPTPELMARIGRPFYEVELECTLDVATGEVKIVSATAS